MARSVLTVFHKCIHYRNLLFLTCWISAVLLHWSPGLRGSDWKLSVLFLSVIKRIVLICYLRYLLFYNIICHFLVEFDFWCKMRYVCEFNREVGHLFSCEMLKEMLKVTNAMFWTRSQEKNSDCQLVSRVLDSSLAHYFALCQSRKCSHLPSLRCTQSSVFQWDRRRDESRGRREDKTREGRFERREAGHRKNSRILKDKNKEQ